MSKMNDVMENEVTVVDTTDDAVMTLEPVDEGTDSSGSSVVGGLVLLGATVAATTFITHKVDKAREAKKNKEIVRANLMKLVNDGSMTVEEVNYLLGDDKKSLKEKVGGLFHKKKTETEENDEEVND